MKRSKPTTLPLGGTISEGTLRPEDLIPAYLSALDALRLTKAERKTVRETRYEWERSAVDYDGADDLIDELTQILESHVPDYAYFGTLEGDGACFGVWPSIDVLQEESLTRHSSVTKINAGDPFPPLPNNADHKDYVMSVTDRGNVTLYRRAGNRWIEVWSVV